MCKIISFHTNIQTSAVCT